MKRLLLTATGIFLFFFLWSCKKDDNPDTTKPFIVVLGSNPVYTELDSVYVDAGAKAYDVQSNGDTLDITDRLQVTNNVNIHERGIYKVLYNVSDAAGNKADEKTRTVVVEIF
ncbi:DUF5011 domain-containing protein [Candidatus Sulfidibacterium hydrothermale]|uniref:immunoglobulin-like domain-containing protein n=1 Tax=Candidatus Sulfidibacterium hydrothermale TaxID=2875962 RepID=UPI001F0AEEFB|nr:immunoglobulin-like domain-containing protein [Candidatus Sulfidibacterium hydrothermale]UBM61793.1 DUF5011 domain-containing protein [Candidatus Sulfidibacterium hydrothermale]